METRIEILHWITVQLQGYQEFFSQFWQRLPLELPKSESCGLLRLMGSKVLATEGRDPVVTLFIIKIQPLLDHL